MIIFWGVSSTGLGTVRSFAILNKESLPWKLASYAAASFVTGSELTKLFSAS